MAKKRKHIIKRKTKILLMGYAKRAAVIGLIIGLIVFFIITLAENTMLKRDNVSLQDIYVEYRDAYEEANTEFVTEYNYWLERYQDLRSSYLELLQYIGEEDLGYEIFTITGYSANDEKQGTNSTTSIGFKLNAQYMDYIDIIAVDSTVIPYGSFVFIKADWKSDGFIYERMFVAGDCGGAIKGQRIDIYFETKTEAERFGVKGCPVKVIINEENIQKD